MIKCCGKYRVYPNKTQERLFRNYLGASRFIYNHCLSEIIYNYNIAKLFNAPKFPTINRSYLNSIVKYLRKAYPFLEDIDKNTLQTSYDSLIRAFRNFFEKKSDYPKFKSRKNPVQTVKINNVYNRIRIIDNRLYWNTFGYITLHGFRPELNGRILHIRIKLENGRWFVIVNYELPQPEPIKKTGNSVGIDFSLKTLMTLSDGTAKVKLQLENVTNKIKKAQRVLSRREYGGKNYNNALKKLHKHINKKNDIINDYYHKLSREIVENYDTIKLETLSIRYLLETSHLSPYIQEVARFKLKNMIQYKAEWYGKKVIELPRHYPSSQLCSNCGYQNHGLKLDDRKWKCPKCGMTHDRDHNASLNILNWK